MSASPSRIAALEVVTQVRERQAWAHETLDTVLSRRSLDARDRAFATRLAYGTIAARGTLEDAVTKHITHQATVEPRVLDALVLSAYELLFMRTARRAAVSEGVELVRSVRPKAAGMANAVLRRVSESVDAFPWGDPDSDRDALSRLHAHPRWMVDLFVDELGMDHARLVLAADNEPAPLYLAVLGDSAKTADVIRRLGEDGAQPEPCPVAGCVRVGAPSLARSSSVIADKSAIVMDARAQLTVAVASCVGARRIVDVGAGRGSKSLLLASRNANAEIIAVDNHAFKLRALTRAAEAAGVTGITVVDADATRPFDAVPPGMADVVLIDAPCSGLGTLRRHPDRRWRATQSEISALAALGTSLLRNAATLVRNGGFMVYSTCTVTREENEDVIAAFLGSDIGSEFRIDSIEGLVPEKWKHFLSSEGWFRSLPELDGPDGHFIVRMQRV